MCNANSQKHLPDFLTNLDGTTVTPEGGRPRTVGGDGPKPIAKSTDVPLGDGTLDAASTSILSRRERMRRAIEEAGG